MTYAQTSDRSRMCLTDPAPHGSHVDIISICWRARVIKVLQEDEAPARALTRRASFGGDSRACARAGAGDRERDDVDRDRGVSI